MAKRDLWKSRLGFMMAAAGSAVGLVNIWRFPYIVGQYGGAAFIAIYLLFLVIIGIPVLISEVTIGRTARHGPATAFVTLSEKKRWRLPGMGITLTGFLVSSFYSVVAGWILGYFVLSVTGGLGAVETVGEAKTLFDGLIGSAKWVIGYHFAFMLLSIFVLVRGVKKGIEVVNKFLMPLLVVLLIFLVVRGATVPGGEAGFRFLFKPDWSVLTPGALLIALGHAFFTLSLGQGTMITYGSYLHGDENIPRTCLPVVAFDTLISLLAAMAVLSLVYAAGEQSVGGEGLLFYTLPAAFAELPGGSLVAIGFFLLVLIAAITSQTSAMEPMINYLAYDRGWRRWSAVAAVGLGAFVVGIPSALAFNWWSHFTIGDANIFTIVSSFAMDVLIPLGGFTAVFFLGWVWGFDKAFRNMFKEWVPHKKGVLYYYLYICIRYVAPVMILIIFLTNLGIFH